MKVSVFAQVAYRAFPADFERHHDSAVYAPWGLTDPREVRASFQDYLDGLMLAAALLRAVLVCLTRRLSSGREVPVLALTAVQSGVVGCGCLLLGLLQPGGLPPLPTAPAFWTRPRCDGLGSPIVVTITRTRSLWPPPRSVSRTASSRAFDTFGPFRAPCGFGGGGFCAVYVGSATRSSARKAADAGTLRPKSAIERPALIMESPLGTGTQGLSATDVRARREQGICHAPLRHRVP